ncbi:MAG TPA: DinB family protein [Terriglobales bacterium]|nr:DinB family protein [Terriglobales bacterium]
MRCAKMLLAGFVLLCCSLPTFAQMQPPPPAKTSGEALNAILNIAKMEFVSAAEAMPDDKYSFAPTSGEFKDVRTFAAQVKHVAAVNYIFGAEILQEKPPVDTGEEKGPASMTSKADILKFLNDSFDYLHKAIASVNEKNELDQIDSLFGKTSRLTIASFSTSHPFDHYGQMAVYLRMNGIVPPASRPRNKQ